LVTGRMLALDHAANKRLQRPAGPGWLFGLGIVLLHGYHAAAAEPPRR
jgi:hypothetical protein